jgi:class 3 adenylate cyclase
MPRFRPLRNASLATRVALVALLVTLASLGVTAAVGLTRGTELANGIADDRLVSVAAARGASVELALTTIRRQIDAMAASPGAAAAITELDRAYRELVTRPIASTDVEELTEFYLADIVPRLERVRGSQVGASFLVPDASAAVYLQHAYTMPGDDGVDIEPALVLDPGDGSRYSEIHPSVHQTYGQIAIASGFDDLFLIGAEDNTIVYSLRKRIDFATSLDLGPHSGSALARVIDQVASEPGAGAVLTDFSAYVPAGERPTAFVASAVLGDDGRPVGFVAASLAIEIVDVLLSGAGTWNGFGTSGDAYLVGPDGTMRSTARPFQESPPEFLASAPEVGPGQLTDGQRRRMAETGTTALVQVVNRQLSIAATGGAVVRDGSNYRGVEARTAVRPIALEGVDWTIFAEVARDELRAPTRDYARQMLLAVALFVVGVTFLVVRWSDRLVAPIRDIATRLRAVRTSDDGTELVALHADPAVASSGPEEYEQLSNNVDEMLRGVRDRRAEVAARSAERAALLRRFLPAAIARRSEEGDGEVLDHVRNASVTVLTLDGLDMLVDHGDHHRTRDLLAEIVDEVDALATELGLERVKLTGATYYAVCGVSRPFLDHATRSVAFGLSARDLVDELSEGRLALHGGVASGPVSVGLTARTALLYDVWGETVFEAEQLARSAPPGTVMVGDTVRRQLPADFVITESTGASSVTGRLAGAGPA